jgi:hypothetical protein
LNICGKIVLFVKIQCFKLFCFQEGFGPQSLGAAYRPAGAGDHDNVDFRKQFLEQRDKKNMEEAEDVDVNAAIHGEKILLYHPKILSMFTQ